MTTPDIAALCERLRYRLDLESDNPYVVSAWSADDVLTRIAPHADLKEIADTLERQAAEIKRLNATCYLDSFMASERKVERHAAEIERLRGALRDIKALPNRSKNPADAFDRGARAARLDAADMAEAALTEEDA